MEKGENREFQVPKEDPSIETKKYEKRRKIFCMVSRISIFEKLIIQSNPITLIIQTRAQK